MSVHYRWFVIIFLLTAFGIYVALPADMKGIDLNAPICQEYALDHTIDLEGAKCDEHLTFSRNAEGEPVLQINITESRGLRLGGRTACPSASRYSTGRIHTRRFTRNRQQCRATSQCTWLDGSNGSGARG